MAAKASENEMRRKLEKASNDVEASKADIREALKKQENAEAAKSALEAMLRNYRTDRKSQALSAGLNGGPLSSPMNGSGDRQSYLNSPTQGSSQSSSPSHPSFALYTSPGAQERMTTESIAQGSGTKLPSEEKQRRVKLSSKFGSYFGKKKETGVK